MGVRGLHKLDKSVAEQCGLTAGKPDFSGLSINERQRCENLVHDPAIFYRAGRLRAHEAIVVAPLGKQQVIVWHRFAEQRAQAASRRL